MSNTIRRLFKGKGFYAPDHTPIAIMPDNQVNDDWHYKLQEVIHENTFFCWHEDEQDLIDCDRGDSDNEQIEGGVRE